MIYYGKYRRICIQNFHSCNRHCALAEWHVQMFDLRAIEKTDRRVGLAFPNGQTSGYETFAMMTLPLQSDLRRYCLAKAGSAWDADDLLQESLIKAYRWHARFPTREITKPFLFQIAANAWVDICRSRKWQPQAGQLEAHQTGSYDEWSG